MAHPEQTWRKLFHNIYQSQLHLSAGTPPGDASFCAIVSDLDESTEREMTDKVDKKLLQNATSLKDNSLFMILQF